MSVPTGYAWGCLHLEPNMCEFSNIWEPTTIDAPPGDTGDNPDDPEPYPDNPDPDDPDTTTSAPGTTPTAPGSRGSGRGGTYVGSRIFTNSFFDVGLCVAACNAQNRNNLRTDGPLGSSVLSTCGTASGNSLPIVGQGLGGDNVAVRNAFSYRRQRTILTKAFKGLLKPVAHGWIMV
ncbi:hypothetical protein GGS26DRAFT_595221 [Hypomontagnella submonticulosa]|nr:hypothetical protein GGS26DRAFT_595221 [Hypomontagnella submonticulosa]